MCTKYSNIIIDTYSHQLVLAQFHLHRRFTVLLGKPTPSSMMEFDGGLTDLSDLPGLGGRNGKCIWFTSPGCSRSDFSSFSLWVPSFSAIPRSSKSAPDGLIPRDPFNRHRQAMRNVSLAEWKATSYHRIVCLWVGEKSGWINKTFIEKFCHSFNFFCTCPFYTFMQVVCITSS